MMDIGRCWPLLAGIYFTVNYPSGEMHDYPSRVYILRTLSTGKFPENESVGVTGFSGQPPRAKTVLDEQLLFDHFALLNIRLALQTRVIFGSIVVIATLGRMRQSAMLISIKCPRAVESLDILLIVPL